MSRFRYSIGHDSLNDLRSRPCNGYIMMPTISCVQEGDTTKKNIVTLANTIDWSSGVEPIKISYT